MTAPTTERGLSDEGMDLGAFAGGDTSSDAPREPGDVRGAGAGRDGDGDGGDGTDAEQVAFREAFRPLLAAALTSGAAGLMAGGIFGSWVARGLGLSAALFGVGWAWLTLRSRRRLLLEALMLPVAFLLGLLALIPGTDSGPAHLPLLVRDAISSGRLLRPPVPFDPGWRTILIVLLMLIGFSAAWVGAGLQRPQLALALPLPVLLLTAISQPAEGEFLAGILAFVPVLLALAVLFGGDRSVSDLSSAFELKRAVRALPLGVGGVILLVILNNSSFLFPRPVYNPAQKPQKPKAIPIGQVRDRVLFEVDGPITGPWKTGDLDVYDGTSWRLPPFDPKRLKKVPGDGAVDKTRIGDVTVKFTVRDLGTSSGLPGVADPTKISAHGAALLYDPRTGTFREPVGRVPADYIYELSLPTYPTADQLKGAGPTGKVDRDFLFISKPPPAVKQLLDQAPTGNQWDRLDFVRKKLNEVVIASGAGLPSKPVPPSKVDDLLVGSHEGSPFEIVAAEAMLARWVGVPARIAFGFDGSQQEKAPDGKDVQTVRPKNGSNWLEAYFQGYGWVPLIGTPPKAKVTLNNDKNTKFNPDIAPSDDVAVELYVPIELVNLKQLYQRIRDVIIIVFPYVVALVALYLATPAARRALRRRRRRKWALAESPRHQVAVEYAEFRDTATDLNVGDSLDTALEYLQKVADDDEHAEFAWLVTRVLYGDMVRTVGPDDVVSAEEMSRSLRRRMNRAQPFQSRVLGVLSRASLREPYSIEMPSVRQLPRWHRTPRPPRRGPSRTVRIRRAMQDRVPTMGGRK